MSNKLKIIILVISVGLAAGGVLLWQQGVKIKKIQAENIKEETVAVSNNENLKKLAASSLEEKLPEQKPITLLFGGDLMFDRYIRQVAGRKGTDFVLEKLAPLLLANDLVAVNLEGPITDNSSLSVNTEIGEKNHFLFTFDKKIAEMLRKYNINLVNLGNNHILNFKEEGARQTENYLKQAGINYFGNPIMNSEFRIKNYELSGLKIGFVNYNQFTPTPKCQKSATINELDNSLVWGCISQGKANALADIKKAKASSDLVILYAHWGKEYETEPLPSVKKLAREFVEAGADLIIGSHPHVVQGKEEYQGKTIYYSLGNFVFDQYFQKETREGLALRVTINPEDKTMNFQEIPLVLQNNGQTAPKN